jgi:hypothetical protein
MNLTKQQFSAYIKQFHFRELFNEMGWNNDRTTQSIVVDNSIYNLQAVAEKSGFKILLCQPATDSLIPDYPTRKKIETKVVQLFHEHLIIFVDAKKQEQIWQLVVRQAGKPSKLTETRYHISQVPELLFQRASGIFFTIAEEDSITIVDVTKRVADNFHINGEKITKRFYDGFKKEHIAFISFLKGIDEKVNQEWYASLMLNRLMFCYFIQKKGFLDNNKNYLRDKLNACQEKKGKNNFYSFYRNFLLVLFHQGLSEAHQNQEIKDEIGRIPYLNGGLFDEHELEKKYKNIDVDDKAFERIFDFFDEWEWHLDTRENATGKEINPDVIGYIFEKYINDRAQMGAYYTKEDITEYISKNCILPYLFDETKRQYPSAFKTDGEIWKSLKESGDRYIYDAVKYGIPKEPEKGLWGDLPEEIQLGINPDQYDLVEKRKAWNKPAPSEIALPTELYREVIDRRKRYAEVLSKINNGEIDSINDFITYNLNIRQFVQDIIENTNDPDFLRDFYKALNTITIIDPTCGSGAFLLAAMNILEPLYEACINRMRAFVEDEDRFNEANKSTFSNKYKMFRSVLEETQNEHHPNLSYFIYKSIILRNLYGVDIMNEAVEIAKLRLFLKLVATVDVDFRKPNMGLEPLPDIDFNFKSGNTLVGFHDLDSAINAINAKDSTGQLGLVFDDELNIVNEVTNKADDLARVFKSFKEAQLVDDYVAHKEAKSKLLNYQARLNDILNEYLAFNYGIDSSKQKEQFNQWLINYQPFHWFAEFYEIIHDRGGFDCVIGNPPYIEYSKIKKEYILKDYIVQDCGNLYGFVCERAKRLISEKGYLSFIVPISITCTQRMSDVQKLIFSSNTTWHSNYGERPSKLFSGAEVLLSIFIVSPQNEEPKTYTTTFIKWRTDERSLLFDKIFYNKIKFKPKEYILPKVGYNIENSISEKITQSKKCLSYDLLTNSYHKIFYRIGGGRYWKIFTDFAPQFILNGNEATSSRENYLYARSEDEKKIIISILSSSIFYWHFVLTTNCRDLNPIDLREFPISLNDLEPEVSKLLTSLCDKLMIDYKRNCMLKEKVSTKTGNIIYQEFYPRLSKCIIDEIDTVLGKQYSFTPEELDFIINYDIKYRMGKELEEEED